MQKEIDIAMAALHAATVRAQADAARPAYHFAPPAQWMNDINGTIFHRGYYHIFYQHNPFGDMPIAERPAQIHWGHARSSDLVHWEHLPIALAPSTEAGEKSCWSGCAALDGAGRPVIFYTAVLEDELPYRKPFEQWAATGDEDLIRWEKSRHNPILSHRSLNGFPFSPEWRDPFIFRAVGRTFMILGVCGEVGVPVFEAQEASLMEWKYAGRLLDASVECPNFFPLAGKWVFISSPFGLVNYQVGTLDLETLRFVPETGGTVDWGHYYGTNVLVDDHGRSILLGWIPGWNWELFQMGRGWNGCMSLPRVLRLGENNQLLQAPVPELQKLRLPEGHVRRAGLEVKESDVLSETISDTCEIRMEVSPARAAQWGLRLLDRQGKIYLVIRHDGQRQKWEVAGASIPPASGEFGRMKLHMFIDRSVVELYINDGEAVVSRMFLDAFGGGRMEIFSERGGMSVQSLELWKLGNPGE